MRIEGVFVGVSAHEDPLVPALRHAHRDAEALGALFADFNAHFGHSTDGLRILTNHNATVEAVEASLRAAVDRVGIVGADALVVHFSCHGGPSGEIVLYDTFRGRLGETGLAIATVIATLTQELRVPVILSLDCCFSGTVLGMDGTLNREAFDRFMAGFTGVSRFVVWASEPGQPAYEDLGLAHGYLSYSLLQGFSRARAAGTPSIRIAEWLVDAASDVSQLARRAGRVQQAGCYALLTSTAEFPIVPIGPRQRRLSEAAGIFPVTANLESLQQYGFQAEEIGALYSRLGDGATLNQLQQDAIAPGGVLAGRSVLVRAPTSGGKTLVAELAMLKQRRTGRKTAVLLPLRALVHEQAEAVRAHYAARLDMRVIVSTGEVADDDDLLIRAQYDVAFFTYEKFVALLGMRPQLIDDIGLVVFDELQMIEAGERGRVLELLLVRLRRIQRERQWPQLIVLCGELANLQPIETWLQLEPVGTRLRPIPLDQLVVGPSGTASMLDGASGQELTVQLPGLPAPSRPNRRLRFEQDDRANIASSVIAAMVGQSNSQVLAFCTSRHSAIRLARWLGEDLRLPPVASVIGPTPAVETDDRHTASDILLELAQRGVGLHTADLNQLERRRVETAFRSSELRVVVATTTLSMGVNFPTDAVVIVDHSFWQGHPVPITIPEFRNMAGRAGRLLPGGPQRGTAILVARSEPERDALWAQYIVGEPSPLHSSLDTLPTDDLALALLQLRESATPIELVTDLGDTYWGFTQDNPDRWTVEERRKIERCLQVLEHDAFVAQIGPGRWALTTLGKTTALFGLRVESGRRLRYAAHAILDGGEELDAVTLLTLVQLAKEMDEISMPRGLTPVDPRPELFARRTIAWDLMIATEGPTAVPREDSRGDRLHRLLALVHWGNGASMRDIERRYRRQVDPGLPVASQLRSMIDRTSDFLPAVAAIVACEFPALSDRFREIVPRLRSQLAVGGNAVIARLYAMRLGLSRGECRALVGLGIDASNVSEAILTRWQEVEAAISTPRALDLRTRLDDPRTTRRFAGQAEQLIFEGIGTQTAF